jgi:hypothetical protein
MARLIDLSEWKKRFELRNGHVSQFDGSFAKDLTHLLKDAHQKKKCSLGAVTDPEQFKKWVEGKIGATLIEQQLIDASFFLCAIYIAELLTRTMREFPESWCAVDYRKESVEHENPFALKKGGDMCFLIAAVFPDRGKWRLMDLSYYEKMGAGFYYEFYYQARAEIGYHMGSCFHTMKEVTRTCLASLH